MNKNNTWEYPAAMEKMPPKRAKYGWVIGDFWARDQALQRARMDFAEVA